VSPLTLLLPVLIPAAAGILVLLIPAKARLAISLLTVLATAAQLASAILIFPHDGAWSFAWLGYGIDASFRLTRFSAFIVLAIAGFSFLVSLYAAASMSKAPSTKPFFAWMLLTAGLAGGAVLADNLVLLLVFWEGLLLTMFGMIAAGPRRPYRTAIKAVIIVGVTDLCMMLGVMLTGHLAGTLTMSAIRLPVAGVDGIAFILLMIGALGKAGAMPFHSWIPDAALDAPLPFMAILPASIEKLLGIYFLGRLSFDLFTLTPGTWVSVTMMIVGAVTIILAVMMALVQKDYKRLLSFHAISQVGYMVLGIGTAIPIGIVGGLFHMINHAMYKSTLFLTGGAVERQAGTTDLEKLGGLARSMPVTVVCFIVAAASISGVPPFNGFFSKEMVYDAALESGWVFYAVALLGSVLTAASFLKLGHAAFFGKRYEPSGAPALPVHEAPLPMLIPMIVLAGLCVLFGVANAIPLEGLIQPAVGLYVTAGQSFAGFPASSLLVGLTVTALVIAALNHWYGVRKTGRGLGAADHIHHAIFLYPVYSAAERGKLDPYFIGRWVMKGVSAALYGVDRAIDWVYDTLAVRTARGLSTLGRRAHNGSVNRYVLWALAGAAAVVLTAAFVLGGSR
jgi:formate hydrogenlyase subunit 3/multisubunit Na+/H+ antiporter MnhD subunit